MTPNLTIIKLLDGTKIFAREIKDSKRKKTLLVKNVRYMRAGENPRYLRDEQMSISYDAIEVFFICHKGGKPKVKPAGPYYSGPKESA